MNPAHVIRECLTNRDRGLGYSSVEIGASVIADADTLYSEDFGLSLIWRQDSSIEEFIASVLDHIDAAFSINRRTGLWVRKLIRADYVAASLLLFDKTNVVDWGRLGRRFPADFVNSVTLRFHRCLDRRRRVVSVTGTARVQAMGEVPATALSYPGIRCQGLGRRDRAPSGADDPVQILTLQRQLAAAQPLAVAGDLGADVARDNLFLVGAHLPSRADQPPGNATAVDFQLDAAVALRYGVQPPAAK